ncbi:Rid family detoxifying hydrolase [Myxococcus sp. MISCRS1]|jgi:2-iminobutanoate/2-iminopropanoate deaminase|uniref:Endoribonuclease n=1 Tax=Myxococcus fulvus TaxID=33 RepID=A0A511TFM0_MYXFU|nr:MULTISPECIES: Rid family detoxifying hydrolase [Myxococcus]MBZ4399863.1 Rid family detoxifying hydrolase [Myxococcus sp. AS-1-15]MBZ4409928.1 Rid family detoxifying hydrolase [Myxococcus sp. XM-1-1-1]MCK8500059.1 Rid family detoxifying hydrolase [Myxococcus fulvus]MCY0997638.1 Rid family detoxifying hydrolase [Myxococcus sp. MISCRS1]SEU38454.1 endoribonuclease L-PSP [Myxococcus fulvus]
MTSTKHEVVSAPGLPKPVGPYSPAMKLESLLFVSGQAATDPATGKQAEGIEAQTEQVLRNLERILVAGGSSLQHVLRCGVFLTDMKDFRRMNAVYERVFAGHRPARTTVQVSALPDEGLMVEIDCVAYVP